jgi:hypothetical protein
MSAVHPLIYNFATVIAAMWGNERSMIISFLLWGLLKETTKTCEEIEFGHTLGLYPKKEENIFA